MNKNLFSIRGYLQQACKVRRLLCTKVDPNENTPIKFSTSKAAQHPLLTTLHKPKGEGMPWYQPYVVSASVAVFLIYFCVLRSENDIDLEFNKSLIDRIKGLEKQQLIVLYKFNKENGKSVDDIEKRLKEIEKEESDLDLASSLSDNK